MPRRGTETEFELTTIERLERNGFTYVSPDDIERPINEVFINEYIQNFLNDW